MTVKAEQHLGNRQDGYGWHGWRLTDDAEGYSVQVGNLPGRKKVALYAEDDESFKVLAYFQSQDEATEFSAWLDRIMAEINKYR